MPQNNIKVAIIGRPNVGKSTLFNRLLGRRKSIIDDMPGVTRDRLYADIEWNKKIITFVDTGGMIDENKLANSDAVIKEIQRQAKTAIEESDFIIFLVDGTSGVTSDDVKIANMLRKINHRKKIFLVVNKIDTEKQKNLIYDFYSLGFGDPYPASALSGSSGLADILDQISAHSENGKSIQEDYIKLAIIGRPNVGKSSILNCLLGKERAIVSAVPGTTRDSIDTLVTVNEKKYLIVDTAGLRRKSKVSSKVERYATIRAIESIERADIVLLVLEANVAVSNQDQKVASLIKKSGKPSVIVVNKSDLIPNQSPTHINKIQEKIFLDLRFIDYSYILFISALEKQNINKIYQLADEAYKHHQNRISTGKLNKVLENIILQTSPPGKRGRFLKIYYATQTNIKPPEIVLFVNDSKLLTEAYKRFLERNLRENFNFIGTPINLVFRNKRKS